MTLRVRAIAWAVGLFLAASAPSATIAAQIPGFGSSPAPAPAAPAQVKDPLGRGTPRRTITAFTRAAHGDNFVSAARYMQVTAKQRPHAEALARELNELMNRYFHQRLMTISDSPEGALDDGLPLDREAVGPLEIGGESFDIGLVRVEDPDAGEIWLISSDTMARLPALHGAIEQTWIERVMPESLSRSTVLGVSWAQLLAWAASLGIPFLLLALVSGLSIVLARKAIHDPADRRRVDSWYAGLRWPVIFILTLAAHLASLPVLGFSLRFRIGYSRVVNVLLIVALAWLLHRLSTLSFAYLRGKLQSQEQAETRSLMLLGERVLKVAVVLGAVFACLAVIGVDTGTVLAGLGIVGVALAIGARTTVENFLGGVFLLTDRAFAVGDMCRIADHIGYIEDITLRSVRLRTMEQTLLSVPAGVLSADSVENFSGRRKILIRSTLRLSYGTSVEQLRSILDRIPRLLAENPKIETGTYRARLIDFGARAIEIELYAYVLTGEIPEFLAVREEVLLQIAEVVEAAGSGFSRPEVIVEK